MSSDEDKPPAPPVRLTSNRATDRGDSVASVDMRPLPKGKTTIYCNNCVATKLRLYIRDMLYSALPCMLYLKTKLYISKMLKMYLDLVQQKKIQ